MISWTAPHPQGGPLASEAGPSRRAHRGGAGQVTAALQGAARSISKALERGRSKRRSRGRSKWPLKRPRRGGFGEQVVPTRKGLSNGPSWRGSLFGPRPDPLKDGRGQNEENPANAIRELKGPNPPLLLLWRIPFYGPSDGLLVSGLDNGPGAGLYCPTIV